LRHRVDGQVAPREVLLDRLALQRHQVRLPGSATLAHAPGAERLGQREGHGALRLGQPAREPFDAARGDEVHVVARPPEQLIAHRAADDPHRLARQNGARGREPAVHAGSPSRW
jgi:hypothetical protein